MNFHVPVEENLKELIDLSTVPILLSIFLSVMNDL